MKITHVDTLVCSGGYLPLQFVKVQTDEGVTGYGECSDGRWPRSVSGFVKDLESFLLGHDPRAVELLNADMYGVTRAFPGGIAQEAVAGIDTALWDIKAKALGVPVYELFGGPTRTKVRLYWSHCGFVRALYPHILGSPPIRSLQDITNLGKEVIRRGFTALKTNIIFPGDPATVYMPGYAGITGGDKTEGTVGSADLNISPLIIRNIENLIGAFRESVGQDIDIALDLNSNFKTEGFLRIAKALEPFNLMWLEMEIYDPQALLQIKESTTTRICSGEVLRTSRGYKPFFDLHAMDVANIDVGWNGFTASKKIANIAEIYEINIALHNCWSHLSSLISAHLSAVVPNIRIMEIDVDTAPWIDDLITEPPEIKEGCLNIPDRPGWGADLNEKEIAKHPWSG